MDLRGALLVLPLTGCHDYGFQELRYVQTFVQDDLNTRADLVFVVDDSQSMVEEQGLLATNFQAFVDAVEGSPADFQAGVVTTDVEAGTAGLLRGGLIRPDEGDLSAAFLAALDVGSDGSRDEQGLAAVALALDGRNPGLIRAGARLNVVVVSDEDDHSPEGIGSYLAGYRAASGSGELVVHAIVGNLPAGCASGVSAADPGERYIEAAIQTGGHRESICADDYREILARIGLELSALQDTFFLDALPSPDTLVVAVDEAILPRRAENGWQYDPARNAIVFDGWAIPRPSMAITVSYELLSGNDPQDSAG